MKNYTRIISHYRVIVFSVISVLVGCTQSLTLETKSDVPAPLIMQLPLNVGVFFDDQFRNYVYQENSEDRPNWAISSGGSQVDFFNQILPSMFENITALSTSSAGENSGVDAILAPQIAEMQFALPQETKTDLYEVWIKYHIQLHSPDGELITEWPITGYGKSSTEFLKSRDEGIQTAINVAFRDAGAKFALSFPQIPEVKDWLVGIPEVCTSNAIEC